MFWGGGQRKYEWTEVSSGCPAKQRQCTANLYMIIIRKQTAGSGKSDRDLTDKMKDAAKNTAMILLGAVTVLVIAGFILFVILEIRLWLLEQTLKKQYEQADMD